MEKDFTFNDLQREKVQLLALHFWHQVTEYNGTKWYEGEFGGTILPSGEQYMMFDDKLACMEDKDFNKLMLDLEEVFMKYI